MANEYDITLLSQTGCSFCKDAKKKLKSKIASGQIKVVELDKNDEMMKKAVDLGVEGTPTFLIKDKIHNTTELCELSDDYKSLRCKNKKINI